MKIAVFYFSVDYGIDIAVLEIPDQSRDEILRTLDHYQPLLTR